MIETFEKIKNIEKYCTESMEDIGNWYNSTAPVIRTYGSYEYDCLYIQVEKYITNESTLAENVEFSKIYYRRGY